ncbi:unnamed protein product [Eruca vesicaria subsp. sativa]|uniref:Uncharacterized protein n=1 Tax=Eruca vesicaria subsp. sativa TaxID=29727 RepID=A0ABC8M555_ERUVS|nr:unnamed protein product [Eruca vesicaria subsp. sativa]
MDLWVKMSNNGNLMVISLLEVSDSKEKFGFQSKTRYDYQEVIASQVMALIAIYWFVSFGRVTGLLGTREQRCCSFMWSFSQAILSFRGLGYWEEFTRSSLRDYVKRGRTFVTLNGNYFYEQGEIMDGVLSSACDGILIRIMISNMIMSWLMDCGGLQAGIVISHGFNNQGFKVQRCQHKVCHRFFWDVYIIRVYGALLLFSQSMYFKWHVCVFL